MLDYRGADEPRRDDIDPDFPPSPYIENIGVQPDIVVDYMTRDNLVTGGVPFIQAFTSAAVALAQAAH